MKKLLSLLMVLLCSIVLFAQSTTNTTEKAANDLTADLTETTVEQDGTQTMKIEYMQSMDEAYFTYAIPSALFEQSEAMHAIRTRVDKFVKDHGYYFYTYLGADETKYDNVKEIAYYTSHFKFLTEK